MTATQDDTIAELQRANAELRRERHMRELERDTALARQAALAEELAARDATLAQRNTEYGERIEQQSATIDVLKAMSASPGDARPVFELIVERARSFCGADHSTAALLQDDLLHLQAHSGMSAAYGADYAAQFPRPVDTSTMFGRAILSRDVMQTGNLRADRDHFATQMHTADFHSIVAVPILGEGAPIGAIALGRKASGGFTDTQIELLKTFAEQAVIAISSAETYRALQESTASLAARNSEYGERIEQQAATIDVLKVMSSSPGNAQPVYELIVERARAFCGADQCTVALLDGDMLHLKAKAGMSEASARNYAAQFPRPVNTASMFGRAILAREAVQTPDVLADPEHFSQTRVGGPDPEFRAIVAVPMLRAGTPIGAIALVRKMPGVYSDIQMELLQTFAEQAVIAITSAETYRALQTRTSDLQETLEYQTATSDVLKVISRSTFDLQPVLDTLVETAARLCDAEQSVIYRREGELVSLVANYGFPPEYEAVTKALGKFPLDRNSPTVGGRASIERRPVHIHDVSAVPGYWDVALRLGKQRTSLGVPLLREGEAIGHIVLARQRVEPFTERQIELASTFADQAVIAIENTRLITGQREALEQQTATAEVLQVINTNPGDLTPVFDAILDKAHTLCGAVIGSLVPFDGTHFRAVATHGFPEQVASLIRHPVPPNSNTQELIDGMRFRQIEDIRAIGINPDNLIMRAFVEYTDVRTALFVPLRKDGALLGFISAFRPEVRAFSEREIRLLENFAAQAVIAMENARLITETRDALEQQTATAEVLQVINASPGDLAPVFDALLEKALRLCEATFGTLAIYDGEYFRTGAIRGAAPALEEIIRERRLERGPPPPGGVYDKIAHGADLVHIADVTDDEVYRSGNPFRLALAHQGGARTAIWVALRKDSTLLGLINIYRQEVRPFSEKQIALLRNFAAQAVIAMENARLLTEQREALEQQTATAEVLRVINTSPGDLGPVFDTMLEKALTLCGAEHGSLGTYDGDYFRAVASRGYPAAVLETLQGGFHGLKNPVTRPLFDGARFVQIADLGEIDHPIPKTIAALGGFRTVLFVPLRKDGKLLGHISASRQEVRSFAAKEIALLENFAAQAVIAMENARLLDEIRQRQAELRVTFENMGDGVAMFDETPSLVAWNRKFQDILDLPDGVLAERLAFPDYIRYLTERGEYGEGAHPEEQIRRLTGQVGEVRAYERTRPDGRVIEIRRNPVPGGGFVLIFSDITERKRNEAEIRAARDAAEEASRTIEAAYRELKAAQANLIQAEKMASLGQLTAGIAHEIKNPLNFVNNFAALSVDLLGELKETAAPGFAALTDKQRAEVEEVSVMLTSNLEKITEHGKRADGIVKAMLEHSRGSSGERRMVDLNGLIDEALNLAYHGARAQDQSFNITLERDFGEGIAPIEVNPQDITRVFLNLFANGFYATTKRAREGGDAEFLPTLKVTTTDAGEAVEIRVRDNGTGIPADIRDKLFQPFFTTKPTGEGTGLGLSITYDIVTQQHGGSIAVDSNIGEYSEFTIQLPRKP